MTKINNIQEIVNGKMQLPEGNLTKADLQKELNENFSKKKFPAFPESLYKNLPRYLREPCVDVLRDSTEKEVFLISALGVLSGCLPNLEGHYDGRTIGPNLYTYILAPYGAGKGAMKFARDLAKPIHESKKKEGKDREEEYEAQLKAHKNGERDEEPKRPGSLLHFIPANNSKTGMLQLLQDNGSRGTLFETEGDTLAAALDQKHGNFGDVLNKSFHHEPAPYYRKTEREYKEIETPFLSVVLSSTFDQYQKLIPTVENGLFSRFLHYWLVPRREFRNVFDRHKKTYADYFKRLGGEIFNIYEFLEGQIIEPIIFSLNGHQETRFVAIFQSWMDEIGEFVSSDLDGTVKRLAVIAFRISMILSALRAWEKGSGRLPNELICTDQDFDSAIEIVEVLKKHAIHVYFRLPRPAKIEVDDKKEKALLQKAEQVKMCRQLKEKGMSYGKVAAEVFGDEKHKSKVRRWLKND